MPRRPATALPEQTEAILQHRGHALQAELTDEAGAELDRQRDPVEAHAGLRHDRDVVVGELAGPAARRRALEKDLDGRKGLEGVRVHADNLRRHLQRTQAVSLLALHAESFSARGQQVHARRTQDEVLGEARCGVGHVLAVVEHEKHALVV